jgi:hypothetical protein
VLYTNQITNLEAPVCVFAVFSANLDKVSGYVIADLLDENKMVLI